MDAVSFGMQTASLASSLQLQSLGAQLIQQTLEEINQVAAVMPSSSTTAINGKGLYIDKLV